MDPRFEWNADKAVGNLRKHGVTFETAVLAFTDPFAIIDPDGIVNGELRWSALGMVGFATLLFVAHSHRDESDGTEVIRIISARYATGTEKRRYAGQND